MVEILVSLFRFGDQSSLLTDILLKSGALLHQEINVVLFAIELSDESLSGCVLTAGVALGFDLVGFELNEFLFKNLDLLSQSRSLGLRLISLLPHLFVVLF